MKEFHMDGARKTFLRPNETMMFGFMSMFAIPEEYLDKKMAGPLMAPNNMPEDFFSGGHYYLAFKKNLMRCCDWKRASEKKMGHMDPFSKAMDDLFIRVVLPNLLS